MSLAFCPNPNNFPRLKAREIIRIWTKRAWNYSLISLVTIWLHILISVPRRKYFLEFSFGLRTVKNFRLNVQFSKLILLINSPQMIFWNLIFHILLPRLHHFFLQKANRTFSDSKMWWREESAPKGFGKIISEALVISESLLT